MRKTIIKVSLVFLSALLIALLFISQTNLLVYQFKPIEPALYYQAKQIQEASPKDTLLVMTWNVKFGGARIDFWFDCYGDRVHMTEEEVITNCAALAKKIEAVNPDILFLQEADIDSWRTPGTDMVQYLLDNTALNYGTYASQWQVNYIPTKNLGKVNSGNAILSKWPLKEATRIALPLLTEQDPVTRFFYLRRNLLITKLDIPNSSKPIYLIDTHTSAYSKENTRLVQLKILQQVADSLVKAGNNVVFGGDFNTLPPGTKKLSKFDDSVCKDKDFLEDDYTKERDWLLPIYKSYSECIPLEQYNLNEEKYYSHTVNGHGFWNRKLDYLFSNLSWMPNSGMVHQDEKTGGMSTMPLSDHAPLTGLLIK